jgi:hypothetical protein
LRDAFFDDSACIHPIGGNVTLAVGDKDNFKAVEEKSAPFDSWDLFDRSGHGTSPAEELCYVLAFQVTTCLKTDDSQHDRFLLFDNRNAAGP